MDVPDLVYVSLSSLLLSYPFISFHCHIMIIPSQCFTDVHQMLSLLLSGNILSILDEEIRMTQYPLVALPVC